MTPCIQWWGEIVSIPPDSWVFCVWFWKDSQSMIIIGSRERERMTLIESRQDWCDGLDISVLENNWCMNMTWRITHRWAFVYPNHPPVTALVDYLLTKFSKVWYDFLLYVKKASEIRLVFSDYLCPRKRRFSMNRFKRIHSIASIKITLLLLQRRLSDDA